MRSRLARWLMTSLLLAWCGSASAQNWTTLDSGVKYQLVTNFELAKCDRIVGSELAEFMEGSPLKSEHYFGEFAPPKYPLGLYTVTRPSVIPEKGNQPIMATEICAVPINATGPLPVVSYQHSTIFGRSDCPSAPDNSMEYTLMLAQLGSQGFTVVAADYFGIGDNSEPNSYLMRESIEQACLDILKATRQVRASLGVQSQTTSRGD